MKIEVREVYKCEYCRKLYQIKSACITHETWCKDNPKNKKACFGCEHLSSKNPTHYFDDGYGEDSMKVKALYCEHFKTYLYPLSIEKKGTPYEFGDVENNPMPKECNNFKEFLPF